MTLFIILVVFLMIGGLLAWYFVSHDHGEKEPVGALWSAAGFGLLGLPRMLQLLQTFSFVGPA